MRIADLIGVWTIHSFHMEDMESGERTEPYGSKPAGKLGFDAGGRFFALITPGNDRPPPITEADQAAAFQKLIAYSGPYRLEPPDRLVTTVDVSWFQPWLGTEQVRYAVLDGDRLDLRSAPLDLPRTEGGTRRVFGIVSWRREKSPA